MDQLSSIARDMRVSDRTLRRGVAQGLVRARRYGPRKLGLSPREEVYLRRYWPLLGRLRALLRTQRNVRLAVLFGSVARGTDRPDSDVDILVSLRDPSIGQLADLAGHLSNALDREVQPVLLDDADRAPSLLIEVLEEGRVLIDRDGEWARLQRQEPQIRRRAVRARRELRERAAAALAATRVADRG